MTKEKLGLNTICTHVGQIKDEQFKGSLSPLYLSTSYPFEDVDIKRYPRYFNTPNQEYLSKKVAALEKAESVLLYYGGVKIPIIFGFYRLSLLLLVSQQ